MGRAWARPSFWGGAAVSEPARSWQSICPMPMATADHVRIFRVEPVVISVLDYGLGFGHSDLVTAA